MAYLIVRRSVGREDPALLQGRASGAERIAELDEETAAVAAIRAKRDADPKGEQDEPEPGADEPDPTTNDVGADVGADADRGDSAEAPPGQPTTTADTTADATADAEDSAGASEPDSAASRTPREG